MAEVTGKIAASPVLSGRLQTASGAVFSVNGQTGCVQLSADDLSALPLAGGTLSGDLYLSGHALHDLASPAADTDALTLGYARKSFAPGDRGIGDVQWLRDSDDIDTQYATGVYAFGEDNPSPNKPFPIGTLIVLNRSANIGSQIAVNDGYGDLRLLARKRIGGTWSKWQYPHPMMTPGVEYPTTALSEGKTVYVKRIRYTHSAAFGNADGIAGLSIPHGIEDFGSLVHVDARNHTANYPLPYLSSTGGITAVTAVNSSSIMLRTLNMTWADSGYVWSFDIYYTKKS